MMRISNNKARQRVAQKRKKPILKYRVVIEPDEDGVHVAEVPALPGCISQGRTRAAAIRNIKEAIMAYLESLKAHGDPVPPTISEEVVEIIM
jgi:predicted RNase H-like HicB family nuclease